MEIPIPPDATRYVMHVFATCNARTAARVSHVPTVHETSLDLIVIEHFSQFAAPVALPSTWVVRIDTHYVGGGRHFGE